MKILFVENHSIFATQVSTQFLAGHEVNVVPSLKEARSSLRNEYFDLLLIDYDLDDGKGDDLIRELRTSGSKVRVIGVSAREEGNVALLQAGADSICNKMNFDRIRELI